MGRGRLVVISSRRGPFQICSDFERTLADRSRGSTCVGASLATSLFAAVFGRSSTTFAALFLDLDRCTFALFGESLLQFHIFIVSFENSRFVTPLVPVFVPALVMNKVEKVSVLRLDFDTFGVIQQWSVIASKISVCFKKSFNIIFDNTYNTLSPSLNLGFCVGGVDLDILKPDDGLKIYKTEKLFENNFV